MTKRFGLTAADISKIYGRPIGTVYRLASERNWERYREGGRTFYVFDDLEHMLVSKATPKIH
ncbi:hypothetical protein [Longispora albida]|uniref:hypothetical protein n=1 Tax=Longispora albida TaxID=203523 RepID=UPI000361F857|nr:hypothetical protein [Longispora albida]